MGGVHGIVDMLGGAHGRFGDDIAGGRIMDSRSRQAGKSMPFATDVIGARLEGSGGFHNFLRQKQGW